MRSVRKGFTLIELLIVVVIIGILAAIAIPKFANTKEKAYLASMKSDLRNLVTAQEAYFSDYTTYSDDQAALIYQPSSGVTVDIDDVAGSGWHATAEHNGTLKTCDIWVGTGVSTGSGNEGEPKCY
jgi:type IV pilus assembly protein PilA